MPGSVDAADAVAKLSESQGKSENSLANEAKTVKYFKDYNMIINSWNKVKYGFGASLCCNIDFELIHAYHNVACSFLGDWPFERNAMFYAENSNGNNNHCNESSKDSEWEWPDFVISPGIVDIIALCGEKMKNQRQYYLQGAKKYNWNVITPDNYKYNDKSGKFDIYQIGNIEEMVNQETRLSKEKLFEMIKVGKQFADDRGSIVIRLFYGGDGYRDRLSLSNGDTVYIRELEKELREPFGLKVFVFEKGEDDAPNCDPNERENENENRKCMSWTLRLTSNSRQVATWLSMDRSEDFSEMIRYRNGETKLNGVNFFTESLKCAMSGVPFSTNLPIDWIAFYPPIMSEIISRLYTNDPIPAHCKSEKEFLSYKQEHSNEYNQFAKHFRNQILPKFKQHVIEQLNWKIERIIWIGYYKNQQTSSIAVLSKDIVKYILSFV